MMSKLLTILVIGLAAAAPHHKSHHELNNESHGQTHESAAAPASPAPASRQAQHEKSHSSKSVRRHEPSHQSPGTTDSKIDNFYDKIMKLETEGADGVDETAECVDESENFKTACVTEVLHRYNPEHHSSDLSKKVQSAKRARGLSLIMIDRLLEEEEDVEESVQSEYQDIEDDHLTRDEIISLRRTYRLMSKSEKEKKHHKDEWTQNRKDMTMGQMKKRKMYLAWAKCARASRDVFHDCIEFGPELRPEAKKIDFVLGDY